MLAHTKNFQLDTDFTVFTTDPLAFYILGDLPAPEAQGVYLWDFLCHISDS